MKLCNLEAFTCDRCGKLIFCAVNPNVVECLGKDLGYDPRAHAVNIYNPVKKSQKDVIICPECFAAYCDLVTNLFHLKEDEGA